MQDINRQADPEFEIFGSVSQEALMLLNDAITKITKGLAPDNEAVSGITSCLSSLRQSYEKICLLADTDTARGLSITELARIFTERNSTKQIKKTLCEFLKVRASSERFDELIRPFRNEAGMLLERLKAGELASDQLKEISGSTEKYSMFMKILAEGLEANEEIYERLSGIFPAFLMAGAAGSKYYVSDEEDTPAAEDMADDEAIPFHSDDIAATSQDTSEEPAIMLHSLTKTEPRKVSASSFQKDIMRKGGTKVVAAMDMFMRYGVLNEDILCGLFTFYRGSKADSDKELEHVRYALQFLEDKKVIARYDASGVIEGFGETDIFCLTKWGYDSLSKQEIRSKIGNTSISLFKFYGDDIDAGKAVNILSINGLLINCLFALYRDLSDRKRLALLDKIKCQPEGCIFPVMKHSKEYRCNLVPDISKARDILEHGGGSEYVLLYVHEIDEECIELEAKYRENLFVLDDNKLRSGKPEQDETAGSSDGITPVHKELEAGNLAQALDLAIHDHTGQAPDDKLMSEFILAILNQTDRPDDDVKYRSIFRASLLAKAASLEPDHPQSSALFNQLHLATALPTDEPDYSGANMNDVFPLAESRDAMTEGLMLSAYLYAMLFAAQTFTDYTLKGTAGTLNSDYNSYFPSFPELRQLFRTVYEFHEQYGSFSDEFIQSLGSQKQQKDNLQRLQDEAGRLMEQELPLKFDLTKMPLLIELRRKFLSKGSGLHTCLEIVQSDDTGRIDEVRDFLDRFKDRNGRISDGIITESVESIYNELRSNKSGMEAPRELRTSTLTSIVRFIRNRLNVLQEWLNMAGASGLSDYAGLNSSREAILQAVSEASGRLEEIPDNASIRRMLDVIHDRFSNIKANPFADILSTGIIPFDNDDMPDLGDSTIKYYEAWRNVMTHIASPVIPLEDAENEILYEYGDNSIMYGNYHHLELIRELRGSMPQEPAEDFERAQSAARESISEFRSELAEHYYYGRITEEEREKLISLVTENEFRLEYRDFGCWRRFLKIISLHVEDAEDEKRRYLTASIKARMKDSSPILEQAERAVNEGNFTAAEEYLNIFDTASESGEYKPETQAIENELDGFAKFMMVFERIREVCEQNKGDDMENLARKLSLSEPAVSPDDDFLTSWPSRKGTASTEQIISLVRYLGFIPKDNASASKIPLENDIELFTVSLQKNDGRIRLHPVSKFGTELEELSIIVVHELILPPNLINTITELSPGAAIVLMNCPVDITLRNQLAREFHTHQRENIYFLMIDQILALFLAMQDISTRLSVLFQCTLPYTSCNPFSNGRGSISPEMFFGRERELAELRNPEGPAVICGGRQLGKTELLRRAETLEHNQDTKRFAVYSDFRGTSLDEEAFTSHIASDLRAKIPAMFNEHYSSLQELCSHIEGLINSGRITSLLLLLDEADTLLNSMNYEPLADLKAKTDNKFRFVMSVLHEPADSTPLGKSSLCIKPLAPFEARRLLLEPLQYLGFGISQERHIETILIYTNYYPGLIQHFGYSLLHKFTDLYMSPEGDNFAPPFSLNGRLPGSVTGSQELIEERAGTLRLSLESDKRYLKLGQCIASLCFNSGNEYISRGFSVSEIMTEDETLTGTLQDEPCEKLLLEMSEMGILSRLNDGKYRFRRHEFLTMLWRDEDALLADVVGRGTEFI